MKPLLYAYGLYTEVSALLKLSLFLLLTVPVKLFVLTWQIVYVVFKTISDLLSEILTSIWSRTFYLYRL